MGEYSSILSIVDHASYCLSVRVDLKDNQHRTTVAKDQRLEATARQQL